MNLNQLLTFLTNELIQTFILGLFILFTFSFIYRVIRVFVYSFLDPRFFYKSFDETYKYLYGKDKE